mgnify:CR=1 FL=1
MPVHYQCVGISIICIKKIILQRIEAITNAGSKRNGSDSTYVRGGSLTGFEQLERRLGDEGRRQQVPAEPGRLVVEPRCRKLGSLVSSIESRTAPAGTPNEVLNKLHGWLSQALADNSFATKLDELGMEPLPMSRTDYQKYSVREINRWAEYVKAAGVEPQ